ncbi:MAG: 3-deoxy-7-phosphoheptulonate synthase [Chlamydiales bacterium]|nr:3-deoxy-7-phosphoheptulonate synthase [Chlamydiales bacterium]
MQNFITPHDLKTKLPLTKSEYIASSRQTVSDILLGKDPRTLLIVGPCSIHNIEAACDYAKRLLALSEEVGDVFYICMRTYFEKPRTSLGWKGFLYDPYLDGSHNIQEGVLRSRELLVYLSELGLAAATEFLEPFSYNFLGDLISWGSVGARTCQSPIHRQLASNYSMPIGFKNRCDGNIDIAVQACLTAKEPHHFIGIDDTGSLCHISSPGNPLAHVVLRGSDTKTNYDASSVLDASILLKDILKALVIDCSHDNSQKNHLQQPAVFWDVINQITSSTSSIRGIMLESFLEAGSQVAPIDARRAQSITDPCLDWETTKQLISQGANIMRQKVFSCV